MLLSLPLIIVAASPSVQNSALRRPTLHPPLRAADDFAAVAGHGNHAAGLARPNPAHDPRLPWREQPHRRLPDRNRLLPARRHVRLGGLRIARDLACRDARCLLLLPSLAGLFGIANLLDIYTTTSHLPPQRENGPPRRQAADFALLLVQRRRRLHGRASRHDGKPGNRVGDGWTERLSPAQRRHGPGMDWETRKLIDMSDDELLAIALEEPKATARGHKPAKTWRSSPSCPRSTPP